MPPSAATGAVMGYASPASVAPGEDVTLRVSSLAPTVRIIAYRIGGYSGGRGRHVWSTQIDGRKQPDPVTLPDTRTIVARWEPSVTTSTRDWPPGFYLVVMRTETGSWLTPLVIRSRDTAGRVALVAPLATWQAYNDWGGSSLYNGPAGASDFAGRSYAVSFDRPYPAPGAGEFYYSVLPFVVAAERTGAKLAYLGNTDIDADPQALHGAAGYVSIGHDEYWTTTMRERVTAARDAGTNLLFTGANTMYWRIRTEPGPVTNAPGGLIVGYKSARLDPRAAADPAQATAMWKDPPGANPTPSLLGTRYECFPVDTAFTVHDPTWWGYARAGVKAGDSFPALLGVEADRVYPGPGTPRPLQVVAHTPYRCKGVPTSAQAVYDTAPSGAGVVNLNSLRWTCALDPGCRDGNMSARTNAFATAVTGTLLTEMAAGPLARRHPAADNLDKLALPAKRTVYDG